MTRITRETAVELSRNTKYVDGTEMLHELCQAAIDWAAKQVEAEPRMLTDAELDEVIEQQWGNAFMPNQLFAHRAFARAILKKAGAREHGELVRRLRGVAINGVPICDEAADALEGKL